MKRIIADVIYNIDYDSRSCVGFMYENIWTQLNEYCSEQLGTNFR